MATDDSATVQLARAMLARAGTQPDTAINLAREANRMSVNGGIPDSRIQAGVLLARLLLEQGRTDQASAVLGDLDAFAATDYRVAWTSLALYGAPDDPAMIAPAQQRAEKLRGERTLSVRPVL